MGAVDEPHVWTVGDEEPADRPHVRCTYQYVWWRTDKGWRSDELGYFDEAKTWWWLAMNRGPLTEVRDGR
jgi:hypothetical protein